MLLMAVISQDESCADPTWAHVSMTPGAAQPAVSRSPQGIPPRLLSFLWSRKRHSPPVTHPPVTTHKRFNRFIRLPLQIPETGVQILVIEPTPMLTAVRVYDLLTKANTILFPPVWPGICRDLTFAFADTSSRYEPAENQHIKTYPTALLSIILLLM